MLSLRRTFTPLRKHLPEIFTAAVLTVGGALGFPKAIDNIIIHPSTQWLEDHASILHIYASPRQETREEVIESIIGNLALVPPSAVLSLYVVASLVWIGEKLYPDDEPGSSDDSNIDDKNQTPSPE